MKKQILTIASWYPNKNNPTLGNFVQKHTETVALYDDVSAIAIFSHEKPTYELTQQVTNGVKEYICYYPKVTFPIPGIKQGLQFLRLKKAFNLAYQQFLAENRKPDAVHLNIVYPLGYFAKKLKVKENISFIVTENSTVYHSTTNTLPNWALKACVRWMNHASKITPVSTDLEKALKKLGVHVPMEIVPNVVNAKIFSELSPIFPEKTEFLHVSSAVDDHKNVSGIIRSIAALCQMTTNFHFRIISDGNLAPFIDLAYKKLKIPTEILTFEGTKTTQEIAEAMNESSALVLFSNYENFPCVIPEMFMVGKPVISTPVNGIPEYVNAKNGILVEKGNEQALTEALLAFIEKKVAFDDDAIRRYSMEHFSYEAVGKQFDRIFDEILQKHVSKDS